MTGTSDHPRCNCLQWFCISYGDCQVRITRPFGCPLLTCASSCALQTLGLWAWPRFSEKSGKKGPWLMVPYGPRSDEKWSLIHIYKRVMVNEWWEMVPTSIWMSIPIHWFIDPVDRSRSILTVDRDSPPGEYGRYQRSIRIHLRRIKVDRRCWIKIRDNIVVDFIDDTWQWHVISRYFLIQKQPCLFLCSGLGSRHFSMIVLKSQFVHQMYKGD